MKKITININIAKDCPTNPILKLYNHIIWSLSFGLYMSTSECTISESLICTAIVVDLNFLWDVSQHIYV